MTGGVVTGGTNVWRETVTAKKDNFRNLMGAWCMFPIIPPLATTTFELHLKKLDNFGTLTHELLFA
jgi:hypothetical protein